MMSFLELLRQARRETYTGMAARLDMTIVELSDIEEGRAPIPPDFAQRVAAAYDLTEKQAALFSEIVEGTRELRGEMWDEHKTD